MSEMKCFGLVFESEVDPGQLHHSGAILRSFAQSGLEDGARLLNLRLSTGGVARQNMNRCARSWTHATFIRIGCLIFPILQGARKVMFEDVKVSAFSDNGRNVSHHHCVD